MQMQMLVVFFVMLFAYGRPQNGAHTRTVSPPSKLLMPNDQTYDYLSVLCISGHFTVRRCLALSTVPVLSTDYSPKCGECTYLIQSLVYVYNCLARDCDLNSIER